MSRDVSCYLYNAFENFNGTVNKCVATIARLKGQGLEFDYVVLTGTSGLLIGPAVAYLTGLKIIVVRKPGVQSHKVYDVEGMPPYERFSFVILDDFVSTGATIARALESISADCYKGFNFLGVIQYREDNEDWLDKRTLLDNLNDERYENCMKSRKRIIAKLELSRVRKKTPKKKRKGSPFVSGGFTS